MVKVQIITAKQFKILKKLMTTYPNYVVSNPTSKLQHILGIYRICPSGKYFLIQENSYFNIETTEVYELTGDPNSDLSLSIISNDTGTFHIQSSNISYPSIHLSSPDLIKSVEKDVDFIESLGFISYSLHIIFNAQATASTLQNHLSSIIPPIPNNHQILPSPNFHHIFTDISGKPYTLAISNFFLYKSPSSCSKLLQKCCFHNTQSSKTYKSELLSKVKKIFHFI